MLRNIILVFAFVLTLVGCASTVPMASPEEDARAKQFVAQPDTAGVYIYRNESFGKAIKLGVEVDGKMIGQTGYNTYFYQQLPAGQHKVATHAENTTELTFDVAVGKLYYIWQEVKMGMWAAGAELHLVDEATGQKAIRETEMAKAVQ